MRALQGRKVVRQDYNYKIQIISNKILQNNLGAYTQFGLSLIGLSFIAVIGLPVTVLPVGVSLRFPNLRN